MRAKLAKQIRKAFKDRGQDVLGPATLVVAKTYPRMVYEMNPETKAMEGKVIKRVTVENRTKTQYRRVKKEVLKQQR